jgi:hypothetical protein
VNLLAMTGPLKLELRFRCWYEGRVNANGFRAFQHCISKQEVRIAMKIAGPRFAHDLCSGETNTAEFSAERIVVDPYILNLILWGNTPTGESLRYARIWSVPSLLARAPPPVGKSAVPRTSTRSHSWPYPGFLLKCRRSRTAAFISSIV